MVWRIRISCLFLFVILIAGCGPAPAPPTPRPSEPTVTQEPTAATATPTPPPTTAAPPGRLRVFSFPPRATIRLDGETLDGTTPWAVDVQPGRHSLEISLPSYHLWEEEVEITSGEILRVEAELQHVLPVILLVTRGYVAFVQWEANSQVLHYATADSFLDEPKDWSWFRHDTTQGIGGVTSSDLPPASQVSDRVRNELGLCPLDVEARTITCTKATALYESPSGDYMVYAPPEIEGSSVLEGVCLRLWHADTEGQNRVFLGLHDRCLNGFEGAKPAVTWSPQEDWILIDQTASGDNVLVFLAKTDGSVFQRFPPWESREEGPLPFYGVGFAPVFSPNGRQIAFAGFRWDEKGEEDDGTWVIGVEGTGLEKVSNHPGLLQWSADGRHLYVLHLDKSATTLYRVDLEENPPQEMVLATNLPFLISGAGLVPRESSWALSPDESALASYGLLEQGQFGIIDLRPGE